MNDIIDHEYRDFLESQEILYEKENVRGTIHISDSKIYVDFVFDNIAFSVYVNDLKCKDINMGYIEDLALFSMEDAIEDHILNSIEF